MIISPQPVDARGNLIPTGAQKELGQEDFLRLFVTKLRYQDPLSPMQDEAFIAQLAEFSSLQQLTALNENFEASIRWDVINNQTINNSVAAQLIGKQVVANLSELRLTEENAPKLSFELSEFASSIEIEIVDAAGETIRTIKESQLPSGRNDLVWDGNNEDGERAPEGSYTVTITATDANGESFNTSLSITGIITGVVYRGGIAFLKIDGTEVALGDVEEINVPE